MTENPVGQAPKPDDEAARLDVPGITDLTERDRAPEARRDSEERFEILFDTAPNAVVVVDHEQRIVLFNESAVSLFGYEAEEIIGQPLVTLLPARFREAHPGHVKAFAEDTTTPRPGAGPYLEVSLGACVSRSSI